MKRFIIVILVSLALMPIHAQSVTDSISSAFFRERWHSGNLTNYLSELNDYVVYHGITSGEWNVADQLYFSINGHPYTMNHYYYDGYRVDDRFRTGSTVLVPDMEATSLTLDVGTARTFFSPDSCRQDYIRVSNTFGGLGGVAPGTKEIIHLFHPTGWESLYRQDMGLKYRPHVTYGLKLDASIKGHEITFKYYRKQNPNYNQDGLIDGDALRPSDYYSLQVKGKLPIKMPILKTPLRYMVNLSQRGDMNSEFYYNTAEQARQRNLTIMLFSKGKVKACDINTGVTFAVNNVKHSNLSFSRNVIDQDGESFEPWVSDGNTYELTIPISGKWNITRNLYVTGDLYNSYIHFSPTESDFSNYIYYKVASPDVKDGGINTNPEVPLYTFLWHSNTFNAGLLENEFLLHFDKQLHRKLSLKSCAGFTVDGFLNDRGTSKTSVNFKASALLVYSPWHWLNIKMAITHDRKSYTLTDLLFFNANYMNADIVSQQTGRRIHTIGGAYHQFGDQSSQTSYTGIEVPIHIYFDRKHKHQLALLQSYRKYHNVWTVNAMQTNADGTSSYTVGYYPEGCIGSGFFTETPYYIQQTTRYTFTGKRAILSISWQSMVGCCISALGNGATTNNIGSLSETSSLGLTHLVDGRGDAPYQAAGRMDQDRAYICRIYWGYNVLKWFSFGIMAKWTDGQPVTAYHAYLDTSNPEYTVSFLPTNTRGINPVDGNFGCRENAIFNIDLHAQFNWMLWKKHFTLNIKCYNAWDFGNTITEYAFHDELTDGRTDMTLNVPRTLTFDLKIDL